MNEKLKSALWYARKGIYVFPLTYDSKVPPSGLRWKEEATIDPDKIKSWWKGNSRYNVGVAPEPSGLVIIDLDDKNGKKGTERWKEIIKSHGVKDTLTVRTPTGGKHLYFYGDPVKSGTDRLAEGVDVKSTGGYVVGMGSTIGKDKYVPVSKTNKVSVAPKFLRELLSATKAGERERSVVTGLELDLPKSIDAARDYLKQEDPAVEGAGGDEHTYKVACRALDFGLSRAVAHDLMLDHWNDRCQPPWEPDELYGKIRNAFSYRQNSIGVDSPELAFEGLEELQQGKKLELVRPLTWPDEASIPPRRWIVGTMLMREKISLLVADPGTGKSTYAMQLAVAAVTGRADVASQPVHEKTKVLLVNNEEDKTEMWRRLYGVMREYGLTKKDLDGKLSMFSGVENPFKIVVRKGNGSLAPYLFAHLKQQVLENGIGLVIVDPLVETHDAEENDNREMSEVARTFRKLAVEANCSILIVHHTAKRPVTASDSYAGNMHGSRGAGAVVGAARIVTTMFNMTEKEAALYRNVENRHGYVRLDDAKANMSEMSDKPTWFKRESIELLNGDKVAVLIPVELRTHQEDDASIFEALLLDHRGDRGPVPIEEAIHIVKKDPMFADMSADKIRRALKRAFDHCIHDGVIH